MQKNVIRVASLCLAGTFLLSGCAQNSATAPDQSAVVATTYEAGQTNNSISHLGLRVGLIATIEAIGAETSYVADLEDIVVRYVPLKIKVVKGNSELGSVVDVQLNTEIGAPYAFDKLAVGETVAIVIGHEAFKRAEGQVLAVPFYLGVVGQDSKLDNVRSHDTVDMTVSEFSQIFGL